MVNFLKYSPASSTLSQLTTFATSSLNFCSAFTPSDPPASSPSKMLLLKSRFQALEFKPSRTNLTPSYCSNVIVVETFKDSNALFVVI